MKKGALYLIGLALLAVARVAWGQAGADELQPPDTNTVVITAKRLNFDYQKKYAVFEEDVVVVDPQVRIEADKLTVVFDDEEKPESATAVGRVKITREDKIATCDRAVYDVKGGRLVLNGNAMLRRGQDVIVGKTITVLRDENKVICEPGRLTLHSQDNKTGFHMMLKE